jgi:hypothetical protein
MIAGRVDPAVAKHLRDAANMLGDPYREALSLRAALCAAAVEMRQVDPDAADQLLREERALADAMTTP